MNIPKNVVMVAVAAGVVMVATSGTVAAATPANTAGVQSVSC